MKNLQTTNSNRINPKTEKFLDKFILGFMGWAFMFEYFFPADYDCEKRPQYFLSAYLNFIWVLGIIAICIYTTQQYAVHY